MVLKIAHGIILMTIKIKDFDFDDILIDEKSCKNILVYDISYKTLLDSKPLLIRFNKVDGFVRVYDGIRYLVLFGPEIYDATYDKIRSFLSQESCIKILFLLIKSKLILMIPLPLEKTLTLHNVIILTKSYFKKDQNHFHYNIFLFCTF